MTFLKLIITLEIRRECDECNVSFVSTSKFPLLCPIWRIRAGYHFCFSTLCCVVCGYQESVVNIVLLVVLHVSNEIKQYYTSQ